MENLVMIRTTMFMLLFLTLGCSKDELDVKKVLVQGEWNWISSYGGEAGETLTPENTMSTATLKIDKFIFREYFNDSLIFETSYSLTETDDPSFSSTNTLIELGNGNILAIVIEDSNLELIEQCFDCYFHKYVRK